MWVPVGAFVMGTKVVSPVPDSVAVNVCEASSVTVTVPVRYGYEIDANAGCRMTTAVGYWPFATVWLTPAGPVKEGARNVNVHAGGFSVLAVMALVMMLPLTPL